MNKGDVMRTPRTAKAAFKANFGGTVVVGADFARQLEIELAEARAKIEQMRQALEEIVACGRADSEDAQEVVIAKAALEAAERGEGLWHTRNNQTC